MSHIRKSAVAIVTVELESRTLTRVPGPIGTVHQQNVLPAIVVVIEKRATGAKRFRKQLAPVRSIVMLEIYSGGTGHVGEMEAEGRSGSPNWLRTYRAPDQSCCRA